MDRTPIFDRLPKSWKGLDIDGVLSRYLGVWDANFWNIQQKIVSLIQTRNVQEVPDRFLMLPISLVGHKWKDYESYNWNRDRAATSIPRYAYKGTALSIKDLAREHGASFCEIKDMASTVIVESKQGGYGNDDNWFYDSDYYHPGVFQIFFSDDVNIQRFDEDFQDIKPAGTKWYYRIIVLDNAVVVNELTGSQPEVIVDAGNNTFGTRFLEDPYGVFEYFDWVPQGGYTSYWGLLKSDEEVVTEPDLMVPLEMFTASIPEIIVELAANTIGTLFWDSINGYSEYSDWVPQGAADTEYVTVTIEDVLATLDMIPESLPEVTLVTPYNTITNIFFNDTYGVFEYYDWVPQSTYD